MSFFDDSHVTDIGLEGSLGPRVGFGEMVAQSFRQQFRVDSARALDSELRNRWLESLRAANISSGPTIDPVGTDAYRAFAQHVSGQPVEATGAAGWGLLGKQDPLDPIREMIAANERIKELNNPNIKTFEQILEEVAQMQHEVETETGSMYERSGAGGFVASLLGAMAGSFTTRDPLNIITAPIGAGRTVATRIASEMAIAAGVVGYTELAEVAPARQIVGLPERNPLFNIAAATAGAGAIRGGIEGIGYGISRVRSPVGDIDFDARDAQLAQMFEANSDKPSARAGAMILDDATFIERNNPFGEGRASQERFIAELQQVSRAMNGEPMTAVGRVMPPLPFEYIKKAADFEIVREQAPELYARMEAAQARVQQIETDLNVLKARIGQPVLFHGSPVEGLTELRTDVKNRTGTPGTVTFTTDRSVAKIYGETIYEAQPIGNFGDYRNPADVEKVFQWRDAEYESSGTWNRVRKHYAKDGPEKVALELELARTRLRERIAKGDYALWENKGLWRDLGWGGAWFEESGARNLSVAENQVLGVSSKSDIDRFRTERRKANAEYQAAYRAVEAEAIRLREAATHAEAAQQGEASNILAQAYGRPFIGPLLRHNNIEALVERINKFNETLDEDTIARFARETVGEGEDAVEREAWRTEDGRVDIGLHEPVDPEFRFVTDEGEMTVAAAMRDLQDDADLVEAIKVCSI